MFNAVLRSILQGYLKFAIAAWISIEAMRTGGIKSDSFEDLISTALTFILGIFIVASPIMTYIFLKKNQELLKSNDFKTKYETLYLNLNLDLKDSVMLTTLFVIRRLLFSLVAIFLSN